MLTQTADGKPGFAAVLHEGGQCAERRQAGAPGRSESGSRIVPPPIRSAATRARTDAGVASAVQSLPHADDCTGRT
ncbi:hypothetical protein [Streptomyces sp. NPDC002550]